MNKKFGGHYQPPPPGLESQKKPRGYRVKDYYQSQDKHQGYLCAKDGRSSLSSLGASTMMIVNNVYFE